MYTAREIAAWTIIALGAALVVAGCGQVYEAFGFPDEEVEAAKEADREVIRDIADRTRQTFWEITTALVAGVGAVASGLLAKWVGNERKLVAAVVRGVEKANVPEVKTAISAEANAAGVESRLHKRVTKLT